MKTKLAPALIIGFAFWLLSVQNALPQKPSERFNGHIFYGQMSIANNNPSPGAGDVDIHIFGADAQKPIGGQCFKYGIETGMIFSIDSDVQSFFASSGSEGGTVAVSVDVNSFLIDYYAGGFVSFEPLKWLRLYVGAGPLIIWAKGESEPEASTSEAIASQSDSGLGVGAYARTGIALFVTEKIGLTLGARITATTLSLSYEPIQIDVEGRQYYFGMAVRF